MSTMTLARIRTERRRLRALHESAVVAGNTSEADRLRAELQRLILAEEEITLGPEAILSTLGDVRWTDHGTYRAATVGDYLLIAGACRWWIEDKAGHIWASGDGWSKDNCARLAAERVAALP